MFLRMVIIWWHETHRLRSSISGKNWVNNHAHVLKFDCYATRRFVEFYLNSIELTQIYFWWSTTKTEPEEFETIFQFCFRQSRNRKELSVFLTDLTLYAMIFLLGFQQRLKHARNNTNTTGINYCHFREKSEVYYGKTLDDIAIQLKDCSKKVQLI